MAWYWWLLIILAVLIVLWLLFGQSRRKSTGTATESPSGRSVSGGSAPGGSGVGKPAEPGADASSAHDVGSVPETSSPGDAAAVAGAEEAPYGEGSARAGADGSGPAGFDIKGNEQSMLYHLPGSASYNRTVAEIWFRTQEEAQAAGFKAAGSRGNLA